ncbi:hypothetical protein CW714_06800 [Methanophagales archaeon]|nr:MAG: hypothetical protein CW714_06800 [Methanophagales archaeon]
MAKGDRYCQTPVPRRSCRLENYDDIHACDDRGCGEKIQGDIRKRFINGKVLKKELILRKYSQMYHNREFLRFSKKNPYEVTNGDIRNYLYHLANAKSTSTLNIAINALKFYYVLKRRFVYEIKRPKEDKKLPVVLSQEEVFQILSSVNNIKHKAILMLIWLTIS